MGKRITGTYDNTTVADQTVLAFIPYPLPQRSAAANPG